MVSAVSSVNSYFNIYRYSRLQGFAGGQPQEAQAAGTVRGFHKAADPETPVQPVRPALPVNPDAEGPAVTDTTAWGRSYAEEQAVRMRIQHMEPDTFGISAVSQDKALGQAVSKATFPAGISGNPAEMAVRMRIQYVDSAQNGTLSPSVSGVDDIRKAGEEGECETCEKRKYQDGSDDPSVSYQTPTRIDPDNAASAVRGHEMEHVVHEQARAKREDRKVVSQSVTLHTGICPECGRVFVSGGTTRTVTKGDGEPENLFPENSQEGKKAA